MDELKEEHGINALNRKAKSQIIKGLDSDEALVITWLAVLSIFAGVVLLMFKVRIGIYLQAITLPFLYFLTRVLLYFHRTMPAGYILSLLSYLLYQPKKIYVRHGSRLFEKKK